MKKRDEDKLVEILLYPCIGNKTHRENHIFIVHEVTQSGKQYCHTDYMTVEEAKNNYLPLGIKVTETGSTSICVFCYAQKHDLTIEEARKKIREVILSDPGCAWKEYDSKPASK